MLVKSKHGNNVFGGYTSICFGKSNSYVYDDESYIFSLTNKKKFKI
jgi:hypothetical protein